MKSDNDFEDIQDDLFSLPWLVNGSLDEEEANRLKRAVEKSPLLQKELDFLMSMRTQVKNSAQHKTVPDLAWQRLSRDMKQQPNINRVSRLSLMSRKLSSYTAIAASLVLGVYLSNDYIGTNPDDYYEPLSSEQHSSDARDNIQLKIRFNASLTRADIEQLLKAHHLVITSGPSSVDLYQVQSNQQQDAEKLIKTLTALEGKIEYVQINE